MSHSILDLALTSTICYRVIVKVVAEGAKAASCTRFGRRVQAESVGLWEAPPEEDRFHSGGYTCR